MHIFAQIFETEKDQSIQKKEIIQKYGIDPMYLHLEITESAYAENPSQIISTVKDRPIVAPMKIIT